MKKFYLLMMFALLGMVANAQTFQKVTDVAQLAAGDKVVIVYENGADSKVMGASTETYRTDVGVSISSEQFVAPEGTTILTLGKNSDGTFTFNDGTGYLEYHGTSNELYTQASGDINWTVTNESIVNSNVTERYLQYNPSAKRFACYKLSSKQKNVCLYKETITTKVSVPEFSIAEGTYYNPLTIDLSCVTADASIFYTINDGAETAYEAPIELSESGEYTIKAWATKEGLEKSEVVSKTYTLKIGEQPMNISLNILEYGTDKGLNRGVDLYEIVYNNVTFVATKGGTNAPKYYEEDWRIYKNGGTLTVTAPDGYLIESIDFVGTINFGSADSGTLENKNWTASENTQQVVFGDNSNTTKIESISVVLKENNPNQVATPTFSLASGTYFNVQELRLSCETEGAKVFYTIDNGEGVSEDREYSEPIQLTNGIYEINTWATKEGFDASSPASAIYEIKVIPFEEINVESVKEGKYVIAYNDLESGKSYIMKNEVVSNYYVGAMEFDLTTDTPAETELFVVKQTEGGYTIQNSENTYVALIQSGKFTNLKPQEANPFVWNFAKSENGNIVATGQGIDSYMSFKMYNTTPEFLAEKNGNYPMFYFVSGTSSVNDAVANEFKAVAVANGIEVNVAEAGLVSVYNAAGQLVANVNVAEGATTINVAGGFYIVKAGNNVAKVLVK